MFKDNQLAGNIIQNNNQHIGNSLDGHIVEVDQINEDKHTAPILPDEA